jgi:DNA-directed RNA polymerase specialized sigma24 family protein
VSSFLRRLRGGIGVAGFGGLSDAQLLDRWLALRDQAAFEVLLWRHGPMILGVCRRLLANVADAEDAFQATFHLLVRKAATIRRRESVAAWLYQVAYRVAVRARARSARRNASEATGVERGRRAEAVESSASAAQDARDSQPGGRCRQGNSLPQGRGGEAAGDGPGNPAGR